MTLSNEEIQKIREQRQEKVHLKAEQLRKQATQKEAEADNIRRGLDEYDPPFWAQPILAGHHSERRHRNLRDRLSRKMETEMRLHTEAQALREKADRVEQFGGRVKGDKERERQAQRKVLDKYIKVGSRVNDIFFGDGEVIRVNKKTYTIRFDKSGSTHARDKTFVLPLAQKS